MCDEDRRFPIRRGHSGSDRAAAEITRLQVELFLDAEQLATLEAERDSLERSLGRLREATLDLDYVEELARTKLSFARPDEILIAVR